jgi:biotin synthase
MTAFETLLHKEYLTVEEIQRLLDCTQEELPLLFKRAEELRLSFVGNKVYGRALIELSNYCKKDCFYCGIRKSNDQVDRYTLPISQVKEAIKLASDSGIGSMAIQSGELSSPQFTQYIEEILHYVKSMDPDIGITLSCGEQSPETYKKWFDAGAERYLLRIEVSDPVSYYKFHPNNKLHSFEDRIKCLQSIKDTGYQTGTGIMIGLPEQTTLSLAKDIDFMRSFDIHMCGMGPFIPCKGTPMEEAICPFPDLTEMSLKMIAVLRIVMKDINIVASTAMETIHPEGRTRAIQAGANVVMPNINPMEHRKKYKLYEKIPTKVIDNATAIIEAARKPIPEGYELATRVKGTAPHYKSN